VGRKNPVAFDCILNIYDAAMTINGVHLGIVLEKLSDEMKGAWSEHVVTVQIRHDVSGRQIQSLPNCFTLPVVSLGDKVSKTMLIRLQQFYGPIGRASVDKDIFQVGISLQENATDGPCNEPGLVIRGSYNRDLRIHRSSVLALIVILHHREEVVSSTAPIPKEF